jgi:membrane protease YdiL (CAAX protease family)
MGAMEPGKTTFYFGLAFALTWVPLVPATLAALGLLPGTPEQYFQLAPISVFAPAIAGVLAARREGGGPAMRELLGGLKQWRVGAHWLVLALAGPTLLYTVGRAVYALVPGNEGGPWAYPPADAQHVLGMIFVPLGEEIGWRGFAMPRLTARHGALKATFMLGALWAVWHVPLFICQRFTPLQVVEAVCYVAIGNVMFTWVWRRAGASLLIAVLLHAGLHANNFTQTMPASSTPLHISTLTYATVAVLLLALDRKAFEGRAPAVG